MLSQVVWCVRKEFLIISLRNLTTVSNKHFNSFIRMSFKRFSLLLTETDWFQSQQSTSDFQQQVDWKVLYWLLTLVNCWETIHLELCVLRKHNKWELEVALMALNFITSTNNTVQLFFSSAQKLCSFYAFSLLNIFCKRSWGHKLDPWSFELLRDVTRQQHTLTC